MRPALLVLICLPLLLAPARSAALEWDHVQVTETARQLDAALADLIAAVRGREPRPGQEELYEAFLGDLAQSQLQIAGLVELLAAGAGREESRSTFDALQEIGQRGLEKVREAKPSAEADSKLQPALGLMWKLSQFYAASGE